MKCFTPVLCLSLALTACGPKVHDNKNALGKTKSYQSITGFRDIKLGSSFEQIISAVDTTLFNPYGLKECFDNLPLSGCGLDRKSDDSIYEMRDGIGYTLSLKFNRHDRLTDVGLDYHREGDITGDQCSDIFARTLDWLSADYGPLDYRRKGDPPDPTARLARTPAGNAYAAGKPDKNGSYVNAFMHLSSEKTELRGKQTLALDRNLSLFSSYIVVGGKPICDVNVEFREPDSVERPAYINNL